MRMKNFAGRMALVLCGLLATQAAVADNAEYPELSLMAGVNFSRGDYGTDAEIEDTYVPIGLTANFERVAFSVKVPYLSVATTSEGLTTTESGLGDVSASLTVLDVLYSRKLGLALDVTGAMKLGTADHDKRLGTGENDMTLYLDGYKFLDNATLFAAIGHRWRGEPADTVLDDVLLATLGVTFPTGASVVGATFDYRESALAGYDDIRELQGFVVLPLSDAWDLEIHAFTGFTDSSPEWGAGITLATDLRRLAFRRDR